MGRPLGKGLTFEQSTVIAAAPAALFALTQDYDRRLEWDPFLSSAKLLGGAVAAAVGVRALCVARSGLEMETEYVSFDPPRGCAIKMTRGPRWIDTFAGSWRFEEVGESTKVTFRYHVRAKMLGGLVTPILQRVFARDTSKRLAALKRSVEERGVLGGSSET